MTGVVVLRYTHNSKEADYLEGILGYRWLSCGKPSGMGGFLPASNKQPLALRMSLPITLKGMVQEYNIANTPEVYSRLSAFAANACRQGDIKLAVTVWETIPHHFPSRLPPYLGWAKKVLDEVDILIPQTERAAQYLRTTYGVQEDRMEIIYPGVDLELFSPQQREDEGGPRVLFVGRLDSWKGIHQLLRAWQGLPETYQGAELWFCGDGSQQMSIIDASRRDPSIKYLGYFERHKLPFVYNQCDIFCMPSIERRLGPVPTWEEQFGFSMVEAMSCGLPVVAYDCGVISEIAGSRNVIVPQGTIQPLREAIEFLLDRPVSRRRIGKANRERVEALFDRSKTAEGYSRVLSELDSGN